MFQHYMFVLVEDSESMHGAKRMYLIPVLVIHSVQISEIGHFRPSLYFYKQSFNAEIGVRSVQRLR